MMAASRTYGTAPYRVAVLHGGPGAGGEVAVIAIHGETDPHPADGVNIPLSSIIKDFPMLILARCGHKPWLEKYASDLFYKELEKIIVD